MHGGFFSPPQTTNDAALDKEVRSAGIAVIVSREK
jgi:rRNA-processing protein FCF1